MENFVDGGLLQKAAAGHRLAVREMCRLTVEQLHHMAARCAVRHPVVTWWLARALKAIESGEQPKKAFGRKGQARLENCKLAVQQLNEMAARCVTGNDNVTPWVLAALEAIGRGDDPNKAFRWRQGRPEEGLEFRNWMIRMAVQDYMRKHVGATLEAACIAVGQSSEVALGEKRIAALCIGVKAHVDLPSLTTFSLSTDSRFNRPR